MLSIWILRKSTDFTNNMYNIWPCTNHHIHEKYSYQMHKEPVPYPFFIFTRRTLFITKLKMSRKKSDYCNISTCN